MILKYLYEGNYFTSLRDTYTDYGSWSESCCGAGGLPSDESIELFLDRLSADGISIIDRSTRLPVLNLTRLAEKYSKAARLEKNQAFDDYEQFDGFLITHFRDTTHVDALLHLVAEGRSLVFISFDPHYPLYRFPEEANSNFLSKIGMQSELPKGENLVTISYGLGKVLLLSGSSISDHALDTWRDRKNTDQVIDRWEFLTSVIAALKSFDIPYLTVNLLADVPPAWLTGEAVILPVILLNLGAQAKRICIRLTIPDYIEPLCSTEFFWDQMRPLERKSVNFIARCTAAGSYTDYLGLHLSYDGEGRSFRRQYPIYGRTEFVSTSTAFTSPDTQVLTAIDLLHKYQSLENHLDGLNDMGSLLQLIEVDPTSTIIKSRTVLEKIVNRLSAKRLRGAAPHELDAKIRRLREKRVISDKLCGWMNTVRIMGNMMAHPSEDSVNANKDDALAVVNILLNLIGELVDSKLL